jgi:hypothetical protein
MSLKSANPPASALPVIMEAAHALSGLPQGTKSAAETFTDNLESIEAAAPLAVYTLGLPNVIDSNLNESRATGWRYLLLQEDTPVAMAEVDTGNDSQNVSFSHFNSGPFVEETAKTIVQAENLEVVADEDYEARILRIPALYVMALWLHGEKDDILIPMSPTNENLEAEKVYSPEDFFAQLTGAARARLEFDDSPREDSDPPQRIQR